MSEETKIGMKMEEETKPLKKLCEKLEESITHEFNKGIENVDVMEMKEAIDMLKDLYEAKKYMLEGCYFKSVVEAMEEHDFDDEEDIMDEGRRGYRGQPRSQSGRFMSRGDGRRSNRGRRGYEEPMYYTMTPEMYHEHTPEWYRDMDREMGKMYYTEGGNMGGLSSGGGRSGSQGGMSGGSSSGGSSGGGSRGYSEGEGGQYASRMQREERDSREGRSGEKRRGYMEAKEMGKDKGEKIKELEAYMKELGSDVSEMIEGASPEEKSMLKQKMQVLMQKIQ